MSNISGRFLLRGIVRALSLFRSIRVVFDIAAIHPHLLNFIKCLRGDDWRIIIYGAEQNILFSLIARCDDPAPAVGISNTVGTGIGCARVLRVLRRFAVCGKDNLR